MDDELDPQTDDSEEQTPDVVGQVQEIFPEEQPDLVAAHVENYQRLNPDASENEVVGAAQGLKQVKDEVAPGASPSAPVEAPSMSEFKAAAAPESAMPARQPIDRKAIMDLQEKARQAADIHPALRILSFMPRFSGAAANLIAEKQAQGRGYQQQIKNMMSLAKEQREEEYRSHEDKRRDAAEGRTAQDWNAKHAGNAALDDPNSPESMAMQELAGRLLPALKDKWKGMPGSRIGKILPTMRSTYDSTNKRSEADARLAETKAHHAQMAGNKKEAAQDKDDKEEAALLKNMGNDFEVEKARGGSLAVEAKKLNLLKHLKALATDEKGNPKNLTNIAEDELAMGFANMVGGGNQQAASIYEHFIPKYIGKDFTKAAQFVSGNPQILNDKEFVKMFIDSAERQGAVAKGIIKNHAISRIPFNEVLRRKYPESYKRVLRFNDLVPGRDFDEEGNILPDKEGPSESSTNGMIPVILPNGKPGMIPPDKLKSLESAGGKRR